jgi:hypothetical protein
VTARLDTAMSGPNPPAAAMGSPSERKLDPTAVERLANEVGLSQFLGKLKRTTLANGDVSYSLPTDSVRAATADVLGLPREAFVHCNPHSWNDHIKVVGTTDRQLIAAMQYAKKRWGDDEVLLHTGDKHRDKVIEHAVRAGLNIANRDPEIQALVVKERERQANPITKDRSAFERANFPLIEHVAPARNRKA